MMDFKRSLTDLGAAERAARGSIGAQRGKKKINSQAGKTLTMQNR